MLSEGGRAAPAVEVVNRQRKLPLDSERWREFTARTWVVAVVVMASLANLTTAMFSVLGPLVSKQSLGGPLAWTVILVGMSVGAIVT